MKNFIKDPMAGRSKTGGITEPVQPPKEVGLRDTLEGMGAKDVAYDQGSGGVTATINGNKVYYKASGLKNDNGRLVGSQGEIDTVINNPLTQVRQKGVNSGVFVGYDQNGNPTYNGQVLDTSGMVNVGDRWYGDGNYLADAAKAVTNRYEDPYKETKDTLLDRLLNYEKFSYNPSEDESLQNAMELARRAAMRGAVERGAGNSSIAEYVAAQAANELIPQYEDRKFQRYLAERDYLGQLMGYAQGLADNELNIWDVNNRNKLSDREFATGIQQYNDAIRRENETESYNRGVTENAQKINEAMNRLSITGVVSDADAPILGLPAGTTTFEAQQYLRGLALDVAQVMGYVPEWAGKMLGIEGGANTLAGEDAYRSWNVAPSGKYKAVGTGPSGPSFVSDFVMK